MAYVFGYNLTHYSERIIEILMKYRGITAKQLTAMMYPSVQYSLSEEKSVYNYLRKLKKQGLVASYKLQANVANGSIYYLTSKGYDCAKDMLNIEEGETGTGWIPFYEYESSSLGDLPYDLYLPPIKQPAHHLMLIDFFVQLNMIEEDAYDRIHHRLNLYAAQTYEVNGHKYRYRPDAEVGIGSKRFAIEIDRATESHEQLLQKFETYKRYLDYCVESDDLVGLSEKIDGIIFVVESKRRDHGIKRRWTNILSAFLKKMAPYQHKVNLIMTTVDATGDTLLFELNRDGFEKKARKEVENILKTQGHKEVTSWYDKTTQESLFAHGLNSTGYQVFFNAISQEFESKLYTRYLDFLNKRLHFATDPEDVEKIRDLDYKGYEKVIFYNKHQPYIVENFCYYDVDPQVVELLSGLTKDVNTYSLNRSLYFSIFK
jgi:hypothetical protein